MLWAGKFVAVRQGVFLEDRSDGHARRRQTPRLSQAARTAADCHTAG